MKHLILVVFLGLVLGCSQDPIEVIEPSQEVVKGGDLKAPPNPYPDLVISNLDTIQYNGNKKINIVFFAEGYTLPRGVKIFNNRVQVLVDGLFLYEPFKSNQDKFNIFTYFDISNRGGISTISHETNPITEDIRDTRWGVFRNRMGVIRYTGFPAEKQAEMEYILDNPTKGSFFKKPYPVILNKETLYEGSGDLPSIDPDALSVTILSYADTWAVELFVHEFAHAFGDLDDEYYDDHYLRYAPIYEPEIWYNPDRPNITSDPVNDRKWDGLIPNPQYIDGGRYYRDGTGRKWRSTERSMMYGVNYDFSPLQKVLLQKRIDEESN